MRIAQTGETVTFKAGEYFIGDESVEVTPGPITIDDEIYDDDQNRMVAVHGAQRYHTTPTNDKVEAELRGHCFIKLQPWGQPCMEGYDNGQSFQIGKR